MSPSSDGFEIDRGKPTGGDPFLHLAHELVHAHDFNRIGGVQRPTKNDPVGVGETRAVRGENQVRREWNAAHPEFDPFGPRETVDGNPVDNPEKPLFP